MSTRLPIPNGDDGTWGDILNTFLGVAHSADGSLLPSALQSAGGVTSVNGKPPIGGAVSLAVGDLSNAPSATGAADGQVLSYHAATSQWIPATVSSGTVNNATSSAPGLVQLSGDLGGTATIPKVTGLNGNAVAAGTPTTNQVLAYNGSQWQNATLTESDVTNLTSDLSSLTSNVSAKYTKPAGGIPATDLTASVQSSLTAAGSAVQLGGDLSGTTTTPRVTKIQGTAISAPSGGGTTYLNATGTWTTPSGTGMSNPMTTQGDLIVGGASGAAQRLAAGTNGYVLTSNGAGAVPSWKTAPAKLFANVVDYGAIGDGSTDNTAAFQAAIAAVTPADGVFDVAGTVFVPAGKFVTGPIVLPQRVGLAGVGMASTIQLAASAPANSVLISNSQNAGAAGNGAQMCFLNNLRLDGNWGNRPAGSWDSAVVFINTYNPTSPYEYSDARHIIDGLSIQYFTGDGISLIDSIINNTNIWAVNGFGYVINNDANIANSNAGGCGLDGFVVGGSSQLTNCKAWYCGSKLTSNRYSGSPGTATTVASPSNSWDGGSGITYSLANGYGNGFLLGSPTPSGIQINGNFATLSGCYAQDNARAGFYVVQNDAILSGCTADTNNHNGTSDGTASGTPVGSYAGFDVSGTHVKIDGLSVDRGSNLNHQAAALQIYAWNTGGDISLQFHGTLNDGSNMPPLASGNMPTGVNLRFNGEGGYVPQQSVATTTTVSPYYGTDYNFWVGQSGQMAAPSLGGTSTTGTFFYAGQRLRFQYTQDGTGHAITFASIYKTAGSIPTTPNSVSIIEFIYDGTNWRQAAPIVTMTS